MRVSRCRFVVIELVDLSKECRALNGAFLGSSYEGRRDLGVNSYS